MIAGATEALERKSRRPGFPINFVAPTLLPEEAFVEDDEEMLHEGPEMSDGHNPVDDLELGSDGGKMEDTQLRQMMKTTKSTTSHKPSWKLEATWNVYTWSTDAWVTPPMSH